MITLSGETPINPRTHDKSKLRPTLLCGVRAVRRGLEPQLLGRGWQPHAGLLHAPAQAQVDALVLIRVSSEGGLAPLDLLLLGTRLALQPAIPVPQQCTTAAG